MTLAVERLRDLTGLSLVEAEILLEEADFDFDHETSGGYREYSHADGCEIWIRPDGGVVRMGPKVKGAGGKTYRRRYDEKGKHTQKHRTGEFVGR